MIKTQIIGNLGGNAEAKTTQDGKTVVSFNVAVTDGWGEQKKTIWFKCSAWGDRWLKLQPYLTKGTKVYVEGKENPTIFEGQQGFTLSRNIFVNDLHLLSSVSDNQQPAQPAKPSQTTTEQFEQHSGIKPQNHELSQQQMDDSSDLPF